MFAPQVLPLIKSLRKNLKLRENLIKLDRYELVNYKAVNGLQIKRSNREISLHRRVIELKLYI